MNIHFYEINAQYIDYLSALEPHFFHNKRPDQQNNRKYIGIILRVNGMDYFAPLSSFKYAYLVYHHRLEKGSSTPLGKRCHDFQNLEKACRNYHR